MQEPPNNLTEEQLKTYEELKDIARMRAGKALGERIYAALASSDLGVRGLARKADINLKRMELGLAGKLILTDDEVLRITDVITADARLPSRQQRARERKMRKALKTRKNSEAVANDFLSKEVSKAEPLPTDRTGFTETFSTEGDSP